MKQHPRILPALFAFFVAMPQPALASGDQFQTSRLRGIRIEAPPQQLYSSPDMLSDENLCGAVEQLRPALRESVDAFVGQINGLLRQRVAGVALVRYNFTVSPDCQARAALVGTASQIVMTVSLPGNRFITNVTTPTIIGQSGDPRLSFTFDAEIRVSIPVPERAGDCLGTPRATVMITNIGLPEGHNLTGEIVEGGVDVFTSVYDFFTNGRLAAILAQGADWSRAVPAGLMDNVNRHLCGSGVPYRSISASYAPGEQLLISFGTGERIEDARCIDGYVWRNLRPDDLVCVTPAVRTQARLDNSSAAERAVPIDPRVIVMRSVCLPGVVCRRPASRPQPCLSGYVWREAIADDFVCVTPSTRAQARDDNANASRRRRDYSPLIH